MARRIPWHNDQNFIDTQTISLIENILASHKKIMPKLSKIDKWPNTDGFVEIQDNDKSYLWQLSVQVKTLQKNHKLKFDCPISFLLYCEKNPCLLLGVDNKKNIVYWLYFDTYVLKDINFDKNDCTKTISFIESQKISKKSKKYIEEWRKIVLRNAYRFSNFDDHKKAFELLSSSTNQAIWLEVDFFRNIHIFLDTINKLLDNDFSIIKKRFYHNQWKIWLAYYEYKPSSLGYVLYPIAYNKNDVQIKKVDDDLHTKLSKQWLGFTMNFSQNPIEANSTKFAYDILEDKLKQIIDAKFLDHPGNWFLANEFVIAFIDKFSEQLWLTISDVYRIEDIKKWFYKYLPLWLSEAHKFLYEQDRNNFRKRLNDGHILYYDPKIINNMSDEERGDIKSNVLEKLKNNSDIPVLTIWNDQMPLWNFVDFLESIKSEKVWRLYRSKDYSRLKTWWVWEVFSPEDTVYNFRLAVSNLQKVYEDVVDLNFPLLKDRLSLFKWWNKIVYVLEKETLGDIWGLWYKVFHLRSEDDSNKWTIDFVDWDLAKTFDDIFFTKWKVNYLWKNYDILHKRSSILHFIYEDAPLLNLVYKILIESLSDYFKSI